MALRPIRAAFIPLLDASILIAARECGFAEQEGADLTLVRETSWANVRDRMAIDHFEVAHMLAPMPIAANLHLTPITCEMIVPMALGLGGNAITVTNALHNETGAISDTANAGNKLRMIIGERMAAGLPKLTFAVVHPHSSHNFELRYWLAACGINPEADIDIVILPPTYMVDAMAQGTIDGYCVGEPWNSVAVSRGVGHVLTTKDEIWASSPEKVLGVRAEWAQRQSSLLSALLRALHASAKWCGQPENRGALAQMMARPDYLGVSASMVEQALHGITRFEPFAKAATFPWQSHALWFYSQMVRWGQVAHVPSHADTARRTYRPDIYRAALAGRGAVFPNANAKVEGALTVPTPVGTTDGQLVLGPDGFFDRRSFDPDQIDDYIRSQSDLMSTD